MLPSDCFSWFSVNYKNNSSVTFRHLSLSRREKIKAILTSKTILLYNKGIGALPLHYFKEHFLTLHKIQ